MKTVTLLALGLASVAGTVLGGPALAGPPPVRDLSDGIALDLEPLRVELRVASPHAFRLHLASRTAVAAGPTTYLADPSPGGVPFSVTREGAIVGIKTAFGELKVDTARREWSLLDDTGKILTAWATLGDLSGQAATGTEPGAALDLACGAAPSRPAPLYYGSGNTPNLGALTQIEGGGKVGNGRTGLPQYWSDSGYGALLVGQFDDRPGTWQGVEGGVRFHVPGAAADLYLTPAAALYDWTRNEAELTGFAPVPPRWAFGYMQSRWGWEDKAYIDATYERFVKDRLPVDAFIFDFEWYTKTPDYQVKAPGEAGFVDFDWNPALFPDPAAQVAAFGRQGLKVVGIRKPRLANSVNLTFARGNDWMARGTGSPQVSADHDTRDLNFTLPEARAWYAGNNARFLQAGMAGFWNDEGEEYFTEFYHWNLAESDLLKQVRPGARFWSLNRAFSPGMQRLGAAVWTGDIAASWRALAMQPAQLLSYGLSGMPYSACDIGGFGGTPSPELLVRWMQAGVFFPIQRSHSDHTSTPRFPWLYGPEAEDAIRKALELRYRLIPYYYSLAYQAHREGAPLMRPLAMEFPRDANVAGMTDEWLMGRGLLAAPQLAGGGTRQVYLPRDGWFVLGTNRATAGPLTLRVTSSLDEVPVYVRAGTLLPLGPVLANTSQPSTDALLMQIYPGHDAAFDLVEDDGETLAYQQGAVRVTRFSWDDRNRTLSWKVSGNYHGGHVFAAMDATLFSPDGVVGRQASLGQDGSVSFGPDPAKAP